MSGRPGRNEMWSRWNDNRQPVRDTPRRELQIRDQETGSLLRRELARILVEGDA